MPPLDVAAEERLPHTGDHKRATSVVVAVGFVLVLCPITLDKGALHLDSTVFVLVWQAVVLTMQVFIMRKQTDISKEQQRLLAQSHRIHYRPRLKLRRLDFTVTVDAGLDIEFELINVGETRAHISEIDIRLGIGSGQNHYNQHSATHPQAPPDIDPGRMTSIPLHWDPYPIGERFLRERKQSYIEFEAYIIYQEQEQRLYYLELHRMFNGEKERFISIPDTPDLEY